MQDRDEDHEAFFEHVEHYLKQVSEEGTDENSIDVFNHQYATYEQMERTWQNKEIQPRELVRMTDQKFAPLRSTCHSAQIFQIKNGVEQLICIPN